MTACSPGSMAGLAQIELRAAEDRRDVAAAEWFVVDRALVAAENGEHADRAVAGRLAGAPIPIPSPQSTSAVAVSVSPASIPGCLHDQPGADEDDDHGPEQLPESHPHDAKRVQQKQRAEVSIDIAGKAAPVGPRSMTIQPPRAMSAIGQ